MAYNEEYDGLKDLDVFTENDEQIRAIPTMNIFTIKPNMEWNPNQAKSCIIALDNLEQKIWSHEDRYAPVLSRPVTHLLTSMTVRDGRKLQQEDYKNTFCKEILPDNEICVV